jgi:hypothetical protein
MGGIVAAAGVTLSARAAPDDGGRVSAAEESMVSAARSAQDQFWVLWNAEKLDELVAEIYTDESVMLPPNHDPIRGRAAIRDYLGPARQELGEYSTDDGSCHPTASATLVSMACEYNFRSGTLRFTAHEAWQRQPDGSVRNMVDMFGFR